MQRNYTPFLARKRKLQTTLKFSWVFLFVTAVFVVYSVFSSAGRKPQPTENALLISSDNKQIKDTVTAKEFNGQVEARSSKLISSQSIPVILKVLPLDYGWPVRGRITTYYSLFHPAVDIAAPRGTPIRPFASGVVLSVVRGGNLGDHLTIAHTNGYETLYAHLNTINVVVGQKVDPTISIGTVGSTGDATGPHLHFQISEDGKTFDPLKILH